MYLIVNRRLWFTLSYKGDDVQSSIDCAFVPWARPSTTRLPACRSPAMVGRRLCWLTSSPAGLPRSGSRRP